jgi:hypothetical protein
MVTLVLEEGGLTPSSIEKRLAYIEGHLARLRPKEQPGEEHAWVMWTTCNELFELEALGSSAGVDGLLSEDGSRRWLAIEAAALSRQLGGWPQYDADRDRYERLDPPDWQIV